MKKLKLLLACCVCTLALVGLAGCSKGKDNSKLVKGTKEEIALSMANDFKNDDYTDFYEKYTFSSNIEDLAKSGRVKSILEPTFNTLGTISGFEAAFSSESANYTVVQIPTHFEMGDLNIAITFDSEEHIYNISFMPYATSLEEE